MIWSILFLKTLISQFIILRFTSINIYFDKLIDLIVLK